MSTLRLCGQLGKGRGGKFEIRFGIEKRAQSNHAQRVGFYNRDLNLRFTSGSSFHICASSLHMGIPLRVRA